MSPLPTDNTQELKELLKEYFQLLKTEVIGKTRSLTKRIDDMEKKIKKLKK